MILKRISIITPMDNTYIIKVVDQETSVYLLRILVE